MDYKKIILIKDANLVMLAVTLAIVFHPFWAAAATYYLLCLIHDFRELPNDVQNVQECDTTKAK